LLLCPKLRLWIPIHPESHHKCDSEMLRLIVAAAASAVNSITIVR
jgi:hypothetical protein